MKQYYPALKPVTNKCDGMGKKCDELEVVRFTLYVIRAKPITYRTRRKTYNL